ncbi:MAG: hypothetical protein KDN20_14565 [Verrucomicrobiae bacterium]|nr:hypothetical protein [Verrucomicrobiae bacterium]
MSKESIEGPLSALRNAGTVCGVCLARGSEVLVNLFPFSESRINDMVNAIDDIQGFFRKNGRDVNQMSFGYDGGCLCIVEDDEFRLIVMHMLADEVDFIAKASLAFLADFHLNMFAEQIAAGNIRLNGIVGGGVPSSDLAKETVPQSPLEAVAEASADEEAVEEKSPSLDSEESEDLESITEIEDENSLEEDSETEEPEVREESEDDVINATARLSENQPESTLPPPRRPSSREA